MSLWFRQRRDGSRATGYFVYLLAGLGAFAAVVLLRHRSLAGDPRSVGGRRGKSSDIAPITQSAATMARVEVRNPPPPPETRSFRLDHPRPASPVPAASPDAVFDAIGAALRAALPPGTEAADAFPCPR